MDELVCALGLLIESDGIYKIYICHFPVNSYWKIYSEYSFIGLNPSLIFIPIKTARKSIINDLKLILEKLWN